MNNTTANTIDWSGWSGSHVHSFSHTHPLNLPPYPPKEPEMSVAEKIAKERKDAKERERIETQYALYDELDLEASPNGSVWSVGFEEHWGALVKMDEDTWSVTGGPHRANLEDVISWLIRQGVSAGDLR